MSKKLTHSKTDIQNFRKTLDAHIFSKSTKVSSNKILSLMDDEDLSKLMTAVYNATYPDDAYVFCCNNKSCNNI